MIHSENQNIEWKASWRDEYLKWICGFANAQGGILIIGKNDKGQVVGISNARNLLENLPNKIRDLLGIVVDINLIQEEGKELLEIQIKPYPTPISYKGQYHYRSGSTKQELKGVALDRFLLRKQGRHWDGVPIPYLKVEELDPQAFKTFREQALDAKRLSETDLKRDDTKLLEKLHLIENRYLKRATALLFHPDPEAYVTGAYIKIGFFESDSEIRYHDEIHGPLLLQIDKALDVLLLKYLKAWISYGGVQRIETYPVPRSALREALLNAIIHKDYGSGSPIQVRVYKHKVTIGNACVLPEDWSVQNLTNEHESRPFNPDIAHVFFRAGQIESWGRGVEKIWSACRDDGLPEPNYHHTGATLRLTFPFSPSHIENNPPEKSGRLNDRLNDRLKLNQTDQQVLIQLQKTAEYTATELAKKLNKSESTIRRSLNKLQKAGKLKRIGSRKTGYWEVIQEKQSNKVNRPD